LVRYYSTPSSRSTLFNTAPTPPLLLLHSKHHLLLSSNPRAHARTNYLPSPELGGETRSQATATYAMGEDKKEKPGKADGGDQKKDAAAAAQPIVLKVDLHCAGCATKVKRAIKNAPGTPASSFHSLGLRLLTVPFFVLRLISDRLPLLLRRRGVG
uniref:HMA domain-containing protein n=1 Tax=Aegilops tauschii subsp. strangulata TaxID=200361 RepID=A0A452YB05_AEGTS